MKTSQLISRLQSSLEKFGDRELVIYEDSSKQNVFTKEKFFLFETDTIRPIITPKLKAIFFLGLTDSGEESIKKVDYVNPKESFAFNSVRQ